MSSTFDRDFAPVGDDQRDTEGKASERENVEELLDAKERYGPAPYAEIDRDAADLARQSPDGHAGRQGSSGDASVDGDVEELRPGGRAARS